MAFNQDDGTLTIYTQVDTSGLSKGLSGITKSMNKLANSMKFLLGFVGFVKLGADAITAASDLNEYRNVANRTFKDQIGKLDELNKTVIDTFGMSELTATKAASSYMAMGNSIGITADKASDMAIELTKLTGDFASFYNLSHERARTALSAVYTGETETLKQYGIILTQVNLQQYENEYGLGRSVQEMTAAEKTLLRYNYVLKATTDAQGDFINTSNQWANQVRVLKERFTELLIVLGRGFISLLSPVITVLNKIIQALTEAINFIGQAVAKLLHLKWQNLSSGASSTADSVGDLGSASEDAADSTGDLGKATTKAAKDTKKSLAPFDDLNVLTEDIADNADDASDNLGKLGNTGGAGGIGGGSTPVVTGGEFTVPESPVKDWFDLGRTISDALAKMLESIDWASIYEKARNFGTGLADFLNGLITPGLFYDVGESIANALSAVVYAALEFAKEFDWANFGKSLAYGLNGFIENFDWESTALMLATWINGMITAAINFVDYAELKLLADRIADAVNKFFEEVDWAKLGLAVQKIVKAILDFFIEFIDKTDWTQVGTSIGTFLANLDWEGILRKAGEAIWKGLGAVLKVFGASFIKDPIETSVLTAFLLINYTSIGRLFWKGLLGGIAQAWGDGNLFTAIGESVGGSIAAKVASGVLHAKDFFVGAFGTIFQFLTTKIPGWVGTWGKEIATNISPTEVMTSGSSGVTYTLESVLTGVFGLITSIGGAILAVVNFIDQWKNGFDAIKAVLVVIGSALVAVGGVILGIVGWPAVIVAAIIGAIAEVGIVIHDNWDAICTTLSAFGTWFYTTVITPILSFFVGLWDGICSIFTNVASWVYNTIITPVVSFFTGLWDTISGIFIGAATWYYDNVLSPIISFIVGWVSRIVTVFQGLWILIQAIFIVVVDWVSNTIITPIMNIITTVCTFIAVTVTAVWVAIQSILSSLFNWIMDTIITPLVTNLTTFFTFIEMTITAVWVAVMAVLSEVWDWLQNTIITPIVDGFTNMCNLIVTAFEIAIASIKLVWMVVVTWFQTYIITPLTTAWKKLTTDIASFFSILWETIVASCVTEMNCVITIIESALNGIVDLINGVIGGFNKIVSWGAEVVGTSWGGVELVPHVSFGRISVPGLATGAVIPPNKEFMAVLGDQKSGTNIEAPLDTIKQAFMEVLSTSGNVGSNQTIEMNIDGETFARLTVPHNLSELNRQGYNVSVLEGA